MLQPLELAWKYEQGSERGLGDLERYSTLELSDQIDMSAEYALSATAHLGIGVHDLWYELGWR